MGRGFGAKASRTDKCECVNPSWVTWELRVTSNGELVITFYCRNCIAFWDTKSRDMRKHLEPDAVYMTDNSGDIIYVRDIIKRADDTRRSILVNTLRKYSELAAALGAASAEVQKELDVLNEEAAQSRNLTIVNKMV